MAKKQQPEKRTWSESLERYKYGITMILLFGSSIYREVKAVFKKDVESEIAEAKTKIKLDQMEMSIDKLDIRIYRVEKALGK